MRFNTHEEAYNFYNSYAGRVGFSIRKASQSKSKKGVSSIRFVCSKQGVGKRQKLQESSGDVNLPKTPEKERAFTRDDCKASFRIKLVEGGIWEVSVFEENHNHELVASPSKKRNLRSQKHVSNEEAETILNLSDQNVGTTQILEFIAIHCGGKGNLRFKKRDVINLIAAIKKKLVGVDVATTVLHFRKKQEEDPEFFYAIEPDKNGTVKNIFWVDGRARRAYKEFGDVVTFDTTYQTNRYNMPLAPFLGSNHHRQTICFGIALLRDESAENFCWLFKTWLDAMNGKHPKAIITDQDLAMKKAIEIVFPNALHRCCQWHVLTKARERLGVLYSQIDGFGEELKYVVNKSLTVEDFNAGWTAMLDKFNLHQNSHLQLMHETQSKWVPAYFRDTFFADMSTTQRSESFNAALKLWVSNHTTIHQFVLQCEKIFEGICQRESDEDIKTMNETAQFFGRYQIEVEARKVYTRSVFSLFKEKVKDSMLGFVHEIERDSVYEVRISSHLFYKKWRPESFTVKVDKEKGNVPCNCKGWEFEGLLCSHAIKVMHHVGMGNLPAQYIIKRWTRDANASVKVPISERSMEPGESVELKALRFASVKSDLMEIGDIGATSPEALQLLKSIIAEAKEKLQLVVPKKVNKEALPKEKVQTAENEEVPILPSYVDPPQSQCKGRRKKPARLKPPAETKGKKRRTCSICNAKEGHNARTCPQKSMAKGKGMSKGFAREDDSLTEDEDELIENELSTEDEYE